MAYSSQFSLHQLVVVSSGDFTLTIMVCLLEGETLFLPLSVGILGSVWHNSWDFGTVNSEFTRGSLVKIIPSTREMAKRSVICLHICG